MVISANPPKSGWDKEMRKFSNKLEVNSKLLQICQKQDQEGKPFSCPFFFFFPIPSLKLIHANLLFYAGAQPAGAWHKGVEGI